MQENLSKKQSIWSLIRGTELPVKNKAKCRQPLYNFQVPSQEFFSPRQVANLLLFSEQTIWRWLRQGRLPAVKIGRYYRIKIDTVSTMAKDGNLLKQHLINQAQYQASRTHLV